MQLHSPKRTAGLSLYPPFPSHQGTYAGPRCATSGPPRDDETGGETHPVTGLGNVSSHRLVLSAVTLKKITIHLPKKKKSFA